MHSICVSVTAFSRSVPSCRSGQCKNLLCSRTYQQPPCLQLMHLQQPCLFTPCGQVSSKQQFLFSLLFQEQEDLPAIRGLSGLSTRPRHPQQASHSSIRGMITCSRQARLGRPAIAGQAIGKSL